jgi:topoisomerase-4 subunit B
MTDLFEESGKARGKSYSAKDIEVLEGLEPVRRRPAMYIGGTGEDGLHHLVAEVLDNAMDEVVAGAATRIELELGADGSVTVGDNGRGIPVDAHPKFKKKSALEVILTTLHSGGKFSQKAYETSGGLHGVGLSVVNALSDWLEVEVARDKKLWKQSYSRGKPKNKLTSKPVNNRRGTSVSFHPDPKIFGEEAIFRPARLYKLARSKAYLFRGAEIRWKCPPELAANTDIPSEAVFHFPGGLVDALAEELGSRETVTPQPFAGESSFNGSGRVEWAIAWPDDGQGFVSTYCNTVPTPLGGTHEAGMRTALARGLKAYGAMVKRRGATQFTTEDISGSAALIVSIFIPEPQFQGQTKEKLVSAEAAKLVEAAVKDHFDHWLTGNPDAANELLDYVSDRADERLRRRQEKDVSRQSAKRKLRLPGKLADCTAGQAEGTEIFLVEGDSAGGSAKQARDRRLQAVLPLRGKILNVASAGAGKLKENQEIANIVQALGCGLGDKYSENSLRYDRVIVMTDADVDGAHIASLLITFFFRAMPQLIQDGHLYLAQPPLYRLAQGGKVFYARDDGHREELMRTELGGRGKVEISRFKGLGEMPTAQLRDTTMDPAKRTLLRVVVGDAERRKTDKFVENLMGRKPENRLSFIQEHAAEVAQLDV